MSRPGTRWPLVLALAVVGCLFAPILAGRILLHRDLGRDVFPSRAFIGRSLSAGALPLWNPEQGLGLSALANPLNGPFYPPNWLAVVGPVPVSTNLVWLAHALFGVAGVFQLARRLGASAAGAAVSGIAFGLSGFVLALWTVGYMLPAISWHPWCGLAFVRLAAAVPLGRLAVARRAALAAIPIASSFLLGEVFLALIGLGVGVVLGAIAASTGEHGPRRAAPRYALGVAIAAVLGGCAGALAVVPAAAAAWTGERAVRLSRDAAELFSFHPARLVELLSAAPIGDVYMSAPAEVARIVGTHPYAFSAYLGASVVALALVALGRGRPVATSVAALGVIALGVALGSHAPFHGWLRTAVPPLAFMRYPEKYLGVVSLVVALLAGLGATRLTSGERLPVTRFAALAILLVVLAATGGFADTPLRSAALRRGAVHGLLAIGAIAGCALALRGRPRAASTALALLVGADLALAGRSLLRFEDAAIATRPPAAAQALLADHHRLGGAIAWPRLFRGDRVHESALRAGGGTVEKVAFETLRGNIPNLFGVAILNAQDAAMPVATTALLQQRRFDLLRLLGADYLLQSADGRGEDRAAQRPDLERVADPMAGVRLYRVRNALPRVYLAGRALPLDDGQAQARVLDPEITSGDVALLAPEHGSALPPMAAADGPPGVCTLLERAPTSLRSRCVANRAALAVFVEQHAPGWSVRVDGKPAPMLRANLIMRAVGLDAGTHEIEMRFSPPGLRAGAVLLAAALLAIAGLLVATRRVG